MSTTLTENSLLFFAVLLAAIIGAVFFTATILGVVAHAAAVKESRKAVEKLKSLTYQVEPDAKNLRIVLDAIERLHQIAGDRPSDDVLQQRELRQDRLAEVSKNVEPAVAQLDAVPMSALAAASGIYHDLEGALWNLNVIRHHLSAQRREESDQPSDEPPDEPPESGPETLRW